MRSNILVILSGCGFQAAGGSGGGGGGGGSGGGGGGEMAMGRSRMKKQFTFTQASFEGKLQFPRTVTLNEEI